MNRPNSSGSLRIIFLTVFIDLLGFGMVLPLLPIYAAQFTEDEAGWKLGLLMASFSAMQFLFAPLWGRLSDRIGRRPVLMVGLAGSAIFYTLFGVATVQASLPLLFVARIGAGVMGATISTAQAYIADCTTLEERPKGMAYIGMAFGMGFTLGPLFGFLAVPDGQSAPGPWPGYAAAILSTIALLMAIFRLPESKSAASDPSQSHYLDFAALSQALRIPSIAMVLVAIFVCLFSFANFETTLSMIINGGKAAPDSPFQFSWGQVCLAFSYIGVTLTIVQGGIVRRLAGRVTEGSLSVFGGCLEIAGFSLILLALSSSSAITLFIALGVVVSGFAFMQPSLNSLLSRRSDPNRQGMILGVGQSVSSMARILGAGLGIPLLKQGLGAPYYVAAGLMVVGVALAAVAARTGEDYRKSKS